MNTLKLIPWNQKTRLCEVTSVIVQMKLCTNVTEHQKYHSCRLCL